MCCSPESKDQENEVAEEAKEASSAVGGEGKESVDKDVMGSRSWQLISKSL